MSLARFEHGAVCAELHEDVRSVARRMRDLRVGCVVVVRGTTPVGIVTDRDLAVRVVAEDKSATETFVSDIVTYDATTLSSSSSIESAARIMGQLGVRRLPIVAEDGRITGIVTADDIVRLLSQEMADIGKAVSDGVDATESR